MKPQVWALVPLKDFAGAKTRLAAALGAEARRALSLAMARDVAAALTHASTVARVLLVSDIAGLAHLMDVPGIGHFDTGRACGLNEDLASAAAWAATQGATHVLIAHADLPRLTPAAIDRFVAGAATVAADGVRAAACKQGSGTNLLLAPLPLPLPLVFGQGSLARFRAVAAAAGVAIDVARDPALAADIDELDDFRTLAAACSRGELSGATASLLAAVLPGGDGGIDLLRIAENAWCSAATRAPALADECVHA